MTEERLMEQSEGFLCERITFASEDAANAPSSTIAPSVCVVSVVGISPFLAWISYKVGGYVSIPYYLIHVLSGSLAIRLQDSNGYVRWAVAFIITVLLSGTKTALFLTRLDLEPFPSKSLLYALTALWECSNTVLIVGGRPLLGRFGIHTHLQSFIAVCSPAQVKFVHNPVGIRSWMLRTSRYALCISLGVLFRLIFHIFVDGIQAVPLLEAEALVILTSCFIITWNLPSHFWQLVMICYPVQVVYPYGSVYWSSSARDFWSRWSRPAGQLLRHMIYHPLGGNARPWMSIPLLFLLNASAHYDVSNALVGDRSEVGWNIVFGVLGCSTTLEVLGNKYLGEECRAYRIGRCIVAMVAFRVAAFVLVHKCLHMSLASML